MPDAQRVAAVGSDPSRPWYESQKRVAVVGELPLGQQSSHQRAVRLTTRVGDTTSDDSVDLMHAPERTRVSTRASSRICSSPNPRVRPNVEPDHSAAFSYPRKAERGAARGDLPNCPAKAGEDGEVPDTPD